MTSGRDIVVVAASAGGLRPLRTMLAGLPADLPAAVLVVLHVSATAGSSLPRILDRSGPLPAARAVNGEQIQPGRVYVAPPDRHLLVVKDVVRLSRGPRQNGLRPAADPLFRSAALHAGLRATAVVLSGALDDAALGSATVERCGGIVLVQDPAEADYDGMPRNAIAVTRHPVIGTVSDLAGEVARLAMTETGPPPAGASVLDKELASEISGMLAGIPETNTQSRSYSDLTCPECGGPLYLAREERAVTYDCLVGHRWSPQALLAEQSASVERVMWAAIRSMEERSRLTTRLAEAARKRGHTVSADQFSDAAYESQRSADALRSIVEGMAARVASDPEPA
jgi:two-component system chemotaxis response regulator CheB